MDNENNAPQPTVTPVTPVEAPAVNDQPVVEAVAPQPVAQPVAAVQDPGKILGIVGFALSFVGGGLVSIILGAIAVSKSKKVGITNGLAIAAIVIGSLGFIFGLWFWFVVFVAAYGSIQSDAMTAV